MRSYRLVNQARWWLNAIGPTSVQIHDASSRSLLIQALLIVALPPAICTAVRLRGLVPLVSCNRAEHSAGPLAAWSVLPDCIGSSLILEYGPVQGIASDRCFAVWVSDRTAPRDGDLSRPRARFLRWCSGEPSDTDGRGHFRRSVDSRTPIRGTWSSCRSGGFATAVGICMSITALPVWGQFYVDGPVNSSNRAAWPWNCRS